MTIDQRLFEKLPSPFRHNILRIINESYPINSSIFHFHFEQNYICSFVLKISFFSFKFLLNLALAKMFRWQNEFTYFVVTSDCSANCATTVGQFITEIVVRFQIQLIIINCESYLLLMQDSLSKNNLVRRSK